MQGNVQRILDRLFYLILTRLLFICFLGRRQIWLGIVALPVIHLGMYSSYSNFLDEATQTQDVEIVWILTANK